MKNEESKLRRSLHLFRHSVIRHSNLIRVSSFEFRISRAAFSLVELLVVLAIIVVLVGLLLPALNRTREMSRRTVCLSNVHQLTQAWLMYAGQNKGWLCNSMGNPEWLLYDPRAATGTLYTPVSRDPVPFITNGQLWPFLKDRRVYICPNDPQQYRNISSAPPVVWVPGATGTSYSVNFLLGPPIPPSWTIGTTSASTIGQIQNAAQRMVFFEGNDGWLFDQFNNQWSCEIDSWHQSSAASMGAITISFADGHAVLWTMAVWGAEKRTWIGIDKLDSNEFGAWMTGVFPRGLMP